MIVLVVDDHELNRLLVAELLNDHGVEVAQAGSLETARRSLVGRRYDAIVLDMNLPDGNGWDFARELRAGEATGRTPILGFSADPGYRWRALSAGCVEFLEKPIDARTFAGIVIELAEHAALTA